jgi:hypothetical protein
MTTCEARADCCKSTVTSKHTSSTTCTISTEFTRQSTTNCILVQTRTPTAALALGSRAVVSWQQQDSARVYRAVIFPVPFTSYSCMWPHLTILRRIVLGAGTSDHPNRQEMRVCSQHTHNPAQRGRTHGLRLSSGALKKYTPPGLPLLNVIARSPPGIDEGTFHIHSTLSSDSLPFVEI